jgi:hypothetical protein
MWLQVRLGGVLRSARVAVPAGALPGDLLSVHLPKPPPPPPKRPLKARPSSSSSLTMDSFVAAATRSSAYLNPFMQPISPPTLAAGEASYVGDANEYVGDPDAADFLVGDDFVLYLRLQARTERAYQRHSALRSGARESKPFSSLSSRRDQTPPFCVVSC